MDIREWQRRLEETFTEQGVVGGGLTPVLDAERSYGVYVASTFHGQHVLADSFQAFVVETLRLAEEQHRVSPLFRKLQWYSYLLLLGLANFRTIRAGEVLFMAGYPGQAYSLLRDLKDRAILLGAVGNSYTSLRQISGLDSKTVTLTDSLARISSVKTKRKKTENAAMAKMIGPQSGLSEKVRTELRKWTEFFHVEVHGLRITSAFEDHAWMEGRELLSSCPKPNKDTMAMYMNRFCEVCWMLLRTLPLLQLDAQSFGQKWTHKWRVLDDSFYFVVEDLKTQGKKIAEAIIELMKSKFAFPPNIALYPTE